MAHEPAGGLLGRRLPDYGIEPVPPRLRRLGFFDHFTLWFSLNLTLLGLVLGSVMGSALGAPQALVALTLGTGLGMIPLGVIAWLGARTGVPGMVLLRAPLGLRGSIAPTVLNVLQTLGFAVFELVVIGNAASQAARGGNLSLWRIGAGALMILLVWGGPLAVVRRVLRAIALPLTLIGGLYLSGWLLLVHHPPAPAPTGALTFWQVVDLALAEAVSWAPLVADYARFGDKPRSALAGTILGGSLSAVWFLGLGVLLGAAGAADPDIGLKVGVGVAVVGMLALTEMDKPFADLYSAVISVQNLRPRWRAPVLALGLGAVVTAFAAAIGLGPLPTLVSLVGACFVPLTGMLLGHAARFRGYPASELFRPEGMFGRFNGRCFAAWLAGFLIYEWIAPSPLPIWGTIHLPLGPALSAFGASIPSFVGAGLVAFILTRPRQEIA
jgi:nucleobase:cation symporter-1, NCS1 family